MVVILVIHPPSILTYGSYLRRGRRVGFIWLGLYTSRDLVLVFESYNLSDISILTVHYCYTSSVGVLRRLVDYIIRLFLPTVHIDGGGAWVGFIWLGLYTSERFGVYFDPTRECGGCAVGARDLILVLVFVLVFVFVSYNLSNISFLFLLNLTATFCDHRLN